MSVFEVLAAGRTAAESRMQSRVTIYRAGGKTTNADGFEVDGWTTVAPDVPFRLGGSNGGSSGTRTVTIGGTEVQVAVRTGHLPLSVTDLRDQDVLDVTSGEHAGTVLRVVEATGADQQTALRVPVYEISRPAGL